MTEKETRTDEEIEAAIAEEENRAQRIRAIDLIARSGLPRLHRDRAIADLLDGAPTLDREKRPKWTQATRDLFRSVSRPEGIGPTVAVLGDNGTGKTMMATAVAVIVAQRFNRSIRYVVAADLGDWALRAMKQDGGIADIISQFGAYGLLIVDEMDKLAIDREAQLSDFIMRTFSRLIDKRYREGRATILLSNLTKDGFCDRFERSMIERINERGGFVVAKWRSFREAT